MERRSLLKAAGNLSVLGAATGLIAQIGIRPARADYADLHFYTIFDKERAYAETVGYRDEGILCFVFSPIVEVPTPPQTQYNFPPPAAGLKAVFRAFHTDRGSHFYTSDVAEYNNAIAHAGYTGEGMIGWVAPDAQWKPAAGSSLEKELAGQAPIPIYRMFNNTSDDHFYTTDAAERDRATGRFVQEVVLGYGYHNNPTEVSDAPGLTAVYRLFWPGVSDLTRAQKIKRDAGDFWSTAGKVVKVVGPIAGLAGSLFGAGEFLNNPLGSLGGYKFSPRLR